METKEVYSASDSMPLLDDDESQCSKPCDPDTGCPECEEYWARMEREGYWDMKRHRWTDKGWHKITQVI